MHKLIDKFKYSTNLVGQLNTKIVSRYITLAEHLMFTSREGEAERLLEYLVLL